MDDVTAPRTAGGMDVNRPCEPAFLLVEGKHLAWKLWEFPTVRETELTALIRSRLEAESLLPIDELVCGVQSLPSEDRTLRRVSVCLARRTAVEGWRQVIAESGGRLVAVLPRIVLLARSLPRQTYWQGLAWIDHDSYDLAIVRDGVVWCAGTGTYDDSHALIETLQRHAERFMSDLGNPAGAGLPNPWNIVVEQEETKRVILSQNHSTGAPWQVLLKAQATADWPSLVSTNAPSSGRTATWPWLQVLPTPGPGSFRGQRHAWQIRSVAALLFIGSVLGVGLWWQHQTAKQDNEHWKSLALQAEAYNQQLSRRTAAIESIRDWLGQRASWTGELAHLGSARSAVPGCEIRTLNGYLGPDRSEVNLRVQGTASDPESVILMQQRLLDGHPEMRVIPYGVRPNDRRSESGWQFEFESVRSSKAAINHETPASEEQYR